MYNHASAFNQPTGDWNNAAVHNVSHMFYHDQAFNQSIGDWITAAVTHMSYIFNDAYGLISRLVTSASTSCLKLPKYASPYSFTSLHCYLTSDLYRHAAKKHVPLMYLPLQFL